MRASLRTDLRQQQGRVFVGTRGPRGEVLQTPRPPRHRKDAGQRHQPSADVVPSPRLRPHGHGPGCGTVGRPGTNGGFPGTAKQGWLDGHLLEERLRERGRRNRVPHTHSGYDSCRFNPTPTTDRDQQHLLARILAGFGQEIQGAHRQPQ